MAKLLHLPNKPDLLTQDELDAYTRGHFGGAKLLSEHGADHIAQLESVARGGTYFMRLDEPTRGDGSLPSYEEIAARWLPSVVMMEPMGVLDYQVGVEPNNVCSVSLCFDWQWLVTMALRTLEALLIDKWMQEGYHVAACRYRLSKLRWWLAPLADGPAHWAGIEQPKGWWDAYEVILGQHLIYGYCVDSYWQYTAQSLQDGFGANVVRHHKRFQNVRPGMSYFVAEMGCSLIDEYPKEIRENPPDAVLARIEQTMLESYASWYAWHRVNAPYAVHSCMFIGRHSAGWRGFEPSDRVLISTSGY